MAKPPFALATLQPFALAALQLADLGVDLGDADLVLVGEADLRRPSLLSHITSTTAELQ